MAKRRSEAAIERAEHWRGLLQRWRESGLSQAEFCRRGRIPPWKLAWWKKRLSAEGVVAAGSTFVPVQMVATAPAEELELTLRDGRVLRFGCNVEAAKLAAIVAALEALPAEGSPC